MQCARPAEEGDFAADPRGGAAPVQERVADDDGVFEELGKLEECDPEGYQDPFGFSTDLVDAEKAEIHLIMRDHGPLATTMTIWISRPPHSRAAARWTPRWVSPRPTTETTSAPTSSSRSAAAAPIRCQRP